MTQDRMTALFFELFSGLPRQGPGDDASTRRALALVPGVGPRTRVLDVGCGTGAQTFALARSAPVRILAVDNHAPFVDELNRRAEALGVHDRDRVEARVADMTRLDLPAGSFDLIWCEGAIWAMGFEAGLREWRRLLTPGGHIAVTEACWIAPDPPPECLEFWTREYPAIRGVPALLDAIEACGYRTIGHFTLSSSSWGTTTTARSNRTSSGSVRVMAAIPMRWRWPIRCSARSTSGTSTRRSTATHSSCVSARKAE